MTKIFKVILSFLIVWILIPWLFGFILKKFEIAYSYDLLVTNELLILTSTLIFVVSGNQEDRGSIFPLAISVRTFFLIILWTLVLQSITIAGIIILVVYSAPLPDFVYHESLLSILIKYVALIPLCEEIFLRLLIQPRLSFLSGSVKFKSIKLSAPVIITALLFAVMHLLPVQDAVTTIRNFTSTLILGLIAGYYYEQTESFLAAYIAHATYNFWGGFLAKVLYLTI